MRLVELLLSGNKTNLIPFHYNFKKGLILEYPGISNFVCLLLSIGQKSTKRASQNNILARNVLSKHSLVMHGWK